MIIEEPLVSLPIENFLAKANLPENFDPKKNHMQWNEIVSLLFKEKDNIEKTFIHDEYLELDATNQEIIGIKAKDSSFMGYELEDKDALFLKKFETPKYKEAKTYGLANASTLFNHTYIRKVKCQTYCY